MSDVVVVASRSRGFTLRDWLSVPKIANADNSSFVPQLDIKERMRVSRRFNPFFGFGEAELFLAFRNGRPVGRISAQVNHLHRQQHDAHSGHFGFFDCLEDEEAARALFDAARRWLVERGSRSITGPFSFSINEESGLQVEGFGHAAAMLMNQAAPHVGRLVEAAGLVKVMDSVAYRISGQPELGPLTRLAATAAREPSLTLRPIRVDRFADEVRVVIDIFNDAWSQNWDFVPFTDAEIKAMIWDLKPFYFSNYGRFIEMDGKPIAFILSIPDVNGVIAPFQGRLLPFNWWKLISDLRGKRFRSARVPLMGIRREYQGSMAAAGILARLVIEMLQEADHYDLDWIEFSWVLENNRPMNSLAQMIAGDPQLRYRYYSAPL